MKTIIALLCCLFIVTTNAYAAVKTTENQNPLDWHISVQPQPSAEEVEAARWSLVLENNVGIYAYAIDSMQFVQDKKGQQDKNKVAVDVKTIFTNKEILNKLQNKYADKLKKGEKVLSCEINMQFDVKNHTYADSDINIYTDKNRLIATQKKKIVFKPVPAKTFAEAMLEICQEYAVNKV